MELILYGNIKDKYLTKEILDPISKCYRTFYYGDGILHGARRPQISIIETNVIKKIKSKNSLIILKKRARMDGLKNISNNIPILASSENHKQLEKISKLGLCVITCGLSEKDTLTFSSVGKESSVVSLQRSFFGHAPMEIPILHSKTNTLFAMQCIAAITIILEKKDEIKLDLTSTKYFH